MFGIEAIAFNNPNIDKVQGIFSEVSHAIERPLASFDRSHSRSISKKQANQAIKKTDAIVDQVHQLVISGQYMIETLRRGDEAAMTKLALKKNSALLLKQLVSEMISGIHRLAYTFFKAEADPAWYPHMSHLKYMKSRVMQAFEDYKKVTQELYQLVSLHLTDEDKHFSPDIETLSSAIRSETVQHPEWVKTGDDFVNWIRSFPRDA